VHNEESTVLKRFANKFASWARRPERKIEDINEIIQELRDAGLHAWDKVDNVEQFLKELRGKD
jgi:hypothetical protein